MGREQPAKCTYCGEAVGDDWVRGEYNLYCSSDCRTAGRMWCWVSMLLFIVPFYLVLWTSYTYNPEILPVLFILLLIILYIGFLVVQGIRIRWRISHTPKCDEFESQYLE